MSLAASDGGKSDSEKCAGKLSDKLIQTLCARAAHARRELIDLTQAIAIDQPGEGEDIAVLKLAEALRKYCQFRGALYELDALQRTSQPETAPTHEPKPSA
jgi:hypothetical protein